MVIITSLFQKSAIEEIVHTIETGEDNRFIYAYRLKEVKGNIDSAIELLEYIIASDFNTAWDKNLWSDIYAFGYVKDIADWFVSAEYKHKLGTVFALLNSLYKTDIFLYGTLITRIIGRCEYDKFRIPLYSAEIVDKYINAESEVDMELLKNGDVAAYKALLTEIFSGKACCHLEKDAEWDWVRKWYEDNIDKFVKPYRDFIYGKGRAR